MVSGEEEIELRKGILAPPKILQWNVPYCRITKFKPVWYDYKACAPYTSRHGCKLYLGSLYIHVVGHHTSQLN